MNAGVAKKVESMTVGTEFLLTNSEGLTKAIAQAWSDEAYRARLFSNARAALSELDVNLPEYLNFRVIEETSPQTLTFILPTPPLNASELSPQELEAAARQTVLFLSTINSVSGQSTVADKH